MPNYINTVFYRFLIGDFHIDEFEDWLYSDADLENQIDADWYMDLISFNFRDKYAHDQLSVLLNKIIDKGDFECWKIKTKLKEFIDIPECAKDLLDDIYDLFCCFPNKNPDEIKQYTFLRHLALNPLYWVDEDYLKSCHGDDWPIYLKRYKAKIPFYHKQLVPIASTILSALDSGEITIYGKGNYTISDPLYGKLETGTVMELKDKY